MTTSAAADRRTVALVDDHPIVIRGMRQLLWGSAYDVVWEAHDRAACLAAVQDVMPDIIILDLRLGQDLGPDVHRELRAANVTSRVVILTGHDDPDLVRGCLEAGVSGVLLKDSGDLDIVRSLDRVLRGEVVLDPRLSRSSQGAHAGDLGMERLTMREHEVLRMVARGLTSRQIGEELHLSVNTVRSYMQAVLVKLDAHTRTEAISIARRERLI
ncbi:response regulator transcription factor [uncultured Arthrobacter sp.]|uniref:response regulator n=1 Tax=uncultured Arthrobacter sp. TaxID=114050 RepID=UPI0025EC3B79|nr:response regulator transcription factor [uncultured Arthrobacter sp.]